MTFDVPSVANYLQIIFINVVLSGDNVVVISMAAAGLAPVQRNKAIAIGIGVATIVRIACSVVAIKLLAFPGLLLAGGLLLLWVCWKMFGELSRGEQDEDVVLASRSALKTFPSAVLQIVVADVSMSLDNVLAVAGAARQNMGALVFGLILSVILMGLAASWLANLLHRYRWIGWIGLVIITYVAGSMTWNGTLDLLHSR